MKYEITSNSEKYKVEAESENLEAVALIVKAMELFYDKQIEYEGTKQQYDIARYQMEQMFKKGNEEFGLKKIDNPYINITFVPASDGKTEIVKQLNEKKAIAILSELGIGENEYMDVVEKTTNKRKESIRVKAE